MMLKSSSGGRSWILAMLLAVPVATFAEDGCRRVEMLDVVQVEGKEARREEAEEEGRAKTHVFERFLEPSNSECSIARTTLPPTKTVRLKKRQ